MLAELHAALGDEPGRGNAALRLEVDCSYTSLSYGLEVGLELASMQLEEEATT